MSEKNTPADKNTGDSMWRVEIDFDYRKGTRIPIVSVNETDARASYDYFRTFLRKNAVVRLYGPGRLLRDNDRTYERESDQTQEDEEPHGQQVEAFDQPKRQSSFTIYHPDGTAVPEFG